MWSGNLPRRRSLGAGILVGDRKCPCANIQVTGPLPNAHMDQPAMVRLHVSLVEPELLGVRSSGSSGRVRPLELRRCSRSGLAGQVVRPVSAAHRNRSWACYLLLSVSI